MDLTESHTFPVLLEIMKASYMSSLEHFDVKLREQVFSGSPNLNFDVFSTTQFPSGARLPILGFQVVFSDDELHSSFNDFSLYHCADMDLLMLGMLSFVSPDCTPNSY